jgi:hypothetical protein
MIYPAWQQAGLFFGCTGSKPQSGHRKIRSCSGKANETSGEKVWTFLKSGYRVI